MLFVDQCNVKYICGYEYLCCFMLFWYKLEPFGRRKLRLRNCLHLTALWANPWSIFLIVDWRRKRRPNSLCVVVPLGKWSWVLQASRLTKSGKSISSTSSVALFSACLPVSALCEFLPSFLSLTEHDLIVTYPDSHMTWQTQDLTVLSSTNPFPANLLLVMVHSHSDRNSNSNNMERPLCLWSIDACKL